MGSDTDAVSGLARTLFSSARLRLRPISDADLPVLTQSWDDPDLLILQDGHLVPRPSSVRIEEQRSWYANNAAGAVGLGFETHEGQLVGAFTLWGMSVSQAAATLSLNLCREFIGQGLGTEATRLAVDYGFRTLPLHRIGLGVYSFNDRARRCYSAAGFVEEGRRRDMVFLDGTWHDVVLMSILRSEWEASRAAKPAE